jgi:hypothetical protein
MTITLLTNDLDRASEKLLIQIAQLADAPDESADVAWYDSEGNEFGLTGHAMAMGSRWVLWTSCDEAGRADYEVYSPDGGHDGDAETLARDHAEEIASGVGSLERPVPDCSDAAHDWRPEQSGCSENPGVSGHGGGVVIREVCAHCGMTRTTDTWADDGHGGHCEAISYEPAES